MTCGKLAVATLSLSSGFTYVLSIGDNMYETPARFAKQCSRPARLA